MISFHIDLHIVVGMKFHEQDLIGWQQKVSLISYCNGVSLCEYNDGSSASKYRLPVAT